MMKKKAVKITTVVFSIVILSLLVFLATFYYQVSDDASQRIRRGVIESIIFSETPIYYDDEKTPIGVLFEKTHRKYIAYQDIPKFFTKALIASEDKNFFYHPGFDIQAILENPHRQYQVR